MNVRIEFRFSALGLSLGANPVFRTFRFVQRLRIGLSARRRRVSIRPKAERFVRHRRALCPESLSVVRREAPVLLPAEGGFQFGRRPNVVLAVGELFVWARSVRSQARRWVSIWPKAECCARHRRALSPGAKPPVVRREAPVLLPAVGGFPFG